MVGAPLSLQRQGPKTGECPACGATLCRRDLLQHQAGLGGVVRGRNRRHAEAGRPQALGQPRGAVLRGLGRRAGGGDGGRHRHEEAGRLVLRGPVGFVVGADPGLSARQSSWRCVAYRGRPAQGVHRVPLADRRAVAVAAQAADDNRQDARMEVEA